jgi:hypothetical protein
MEHQEAAHICTCCMGLFPKPTVENETDEDDEVEEEEARVSEEDKEKEEIKEGDRIFMTAFHPEEKRIHATGNFSQQLTEAFHHNSNAKTFRNMVISVTPQ